MEWGFLKMKFKSGNIVNYRGDSGWYVLVADQESGKYSLMKRHDNGRTETRVCTEEDVFEESKFKMGDIVMCHGNICVIQSMGNKDESGKTIYRLRCLFDKPYELTSTDDHLKKLDIKDFEIGMDIVKHVSGGVTWYSYSEEDKKQKQRLDLYTINTISDKIDEYLEVNGWALESLASITSWIEGLKTGKEN